MASMVAERCLFSLETLEFASFPAETSFALTEHEDAEIWRWATVNSLGQIVEEGRESTEGKAQCAAEVALRLDVA